MSVKVFINPSLTYLTDDQEVVEVEGTNVGECLEQLIGRFPGLKEPLFGEDGRLNDHIDIFVNLESAYPEELKKPVRDGDELNIISMVAGG